MNLHHLAIIMDGNLRWANKYSLPLMEAYKKGAERVLALLDFCILSNISYLTLYAFSTENLKRPPAVVEGLFQIFQQYFKENTSYLVEKGIKTKFIGERALLPPEIISTINEIEKITAHNDKLVLTVAFNYGGRQEIINAIKQISFLRLCPTKIDQALLQSLLYTSSLPDPDLLIRTSGEKRLSNFLLWQLAYTELYFSNTLWPDFTTEDLRMALQDFFKRKRRYGC